MTTTKVSHYDHLRVEVTYPDGKGTHETTILELKERFKSESKSWLKSFLLDIVKRGTGYTRVGKYTLIKEDN